MHWNLPKYTKAEERAYPIIVTRVLTGHDLPWLEQERVRIGRESDTEAKIFRVQNGARYFLARTKGKGDE